MASITSIGDLPPELLGKVLSRLGTARDVAQAMSVSKQFRSASSRVENLRFWFSTGAEDIDGTESMYNAAWLGKAAQDNITRFVEGSQHCQSLEISCTNESLSPSHPAVKWTGFSPEVVRAWLRHVRPTLEILHLDNFLLTPVSELPPDVREGIPEGGGSKPQGGSRLRAIVKMVVRAGNGPGRLRRAGGSGDLSLSRKLPKLRKAGGSVDLSLALSQWQRGEGSAEYGSTNGSPGRSLSGSSRGASPIHPISPSTDVTSTRSSRERESLPSTPKNSPPRVPSQLPKATSSQNLSPSSLSNAGHLSLTDMLAALEGSPTVQRIFASQVLVPPAVAPFRLDALRVLHISNPLCAPTSAALNSILAGCRQLSQLYLSEMDGLGLATCSYALASESLRVLCASKAKLGALKLNTPKLEVLDLEQVHPLVLVVLQEATHLETLRVRECGSADHREDLFIMGATCLREIEIDATSIGYFNAGLSMVRTAGDALRSLAVKVVPPVLPANIFEMAMEMPDLRFLSIGRDLWDAILRGKGEVWWSHFAWGRLVELQIDFGLPQFAALNLLHDFVTRCSGLQQLVLRCASRDAHAWIQAPMHDFLENNCPQVALRMELLKGEDCFSLEALAAAAT